ncbi:MAG: LLM class flavin-dependent oxidoreductase [Alphaproteobacteria bacterium]|nr:LLM class flavin-dependent oxidoreductase [Alphaproteobacteria bacterium]
MQRKMKWGVFSLSQYPDQSMRVEGLEADMRLFELAEALGYDTVWLAEHLFSTYGIVTSTQVLAATVVERVKRMRIGTAVVVVPFSHPLRTAADFALIDCLSRGRLNFGIGRAYQPHEFAGLGVPMSESREMFNEGIELILKAWTQEKITHKGKYWNVAEPIEVLPKPVQIPHPPVYQATISPESFDQAGKHGWSIQLAAPFSYRTYREEWIARLSLEVKRYEKTLAQHGHDPKRLERMMLVPFFTDTDDARARRTMQPHVEWFYNKVATHQQPTGNSLVPGYELTMAEGRKSRELGYLAFERLAEFGACVVGDPAACIKKLKQMKEMLGVTEFVLWSNLGGMPPVRAEQSIRLAWEEIVPYV